MWVCRCIRKDHQQQKETLKPDLSCACAACFGIPRAPRNNCSWRSLPRSRYGIVSILLRSLYNLFDLYGMALSSLGQLQLIRILLLFFVFFDVGVSTVLFLQVGSPHRSVVETIADQVHVYELRVASHSLSRLNLE